MEEKEIKTPSMLTVSPSPHARRGDTTASVMKEVIIALLPAAVWGCYRFGWSALWVLLCAVASAVLTEALTEILLHKKVTVADCSAALTGLLLGMNLPASVPLYVPIVGSVFAILVVKQLFGGIGKNFLNPALAARVFLMMCWTEQMTDFRDGLDAVASATPLASLKNGLMPEGKTVLDLFLGKSGGCIGEVSALLLLVGGIYLIARRIIRWQIPVCYVGTVAVLTFLFPKTGNPLEFMLSSIFSGGLMIGALFMATDYVTSPVTTWGRVIYGVGCGLLTVFLRSFSGYNEGVSFAILIMNSLVWYLDMATKPRVYGKTKKKGA